MQWRLLARQLLPGLSSHICLFQEGGTCLEGALLLIRHCTCCRPIYAGNALETVKYSSPGTRLLTVRTTAFEAAPGQGSAVIAAVSSGELDAAQVSLPLTRPAALAMCHYKPCAAGRQLHILCSCALLSILAVLVLP